MGNVVNNNPLSWRLVVFNVFGESTCDVLLYLLVILSQTVWLTF